MQIFARITKVDEATRRVTGIAASEVVDKTNEMLDYELSKQHFVEWSEGVAKATNGLSVGNLRVMHGNTVAGKLVEMACDDATKSFPVTAEIVDDNEWKKVLMGCYTGFSIGGKYVSKSAKDSAGVVRYVAKPNELSLVDLPCNQDATFTVIKSDGTEDLRKFETNVDDAEALAKWVDGLTDDQRDTLAKIAKRPGVDPKEGDDKYGDVPFADEKNKKYPIDTPAHIRAAWNYINKPKNAAKYSGMDLRTIKGKIIAAWKEKIDKNGPPSAAKDDAAKGEGLAIADCRASALLEKMDRAEPLLKTIYTALGEEPLAKGLYTVSSLAQMLCGLSNLAQECAWEAAWEGDHSAVPGELRSVIHDLAGVLLDMADEETEELLATLDEANKSLTGDLQKGANSPQEDDMDLELKKSLDTAQADLAKAIGERDELTKALATATAGITERDELLQKAAAALNERNALIAKLEAMPAPIKAAMRAVAKGDDLNQEEGKGDVKILKQDGTVDEAATALRKALDNPVFIR